MKAIAVIAEDEPPARARLVEALASVAPQARVVGQADSVRGTDAIAAIGAFQGELSSEPSCSSRPSRSGRSPRRRALAPAMEDLLRGVDIRPV